MNKRTIADKLRRLMQQRDMTPSELSRASGVPLTTVLSISKDQRKSPGVDTIEKLSSALRVSPIYFFSDRAIDLADLGEMIALPDDLRELITKAEFFPYLLLSERAFSGSISHDVLQKIVDSILEGRKGS